MENENKNKSIITIVIGIAIGGIGIWLLTKNNNARNRNRYAERNTSTSTSGNISDAFNSGNPVPPVITNSIVNTNYLGGQKQAAKDCASNKGYGVTMEGVYGDNTSADFKQGYNDYMNTICPTITPAVGFVPAGIAPVATATDTTPPPASTTTNNIII